MAILWQKKTAAKTYQVRTAGNSLRLYTDGVLHTQYNPHHVASGHVWDLLTIPVFFQAPGTIRRVLVLGVGGGAALHFLRRYVRPESIIGIDNDAVHLYVARKFFQLQKPGIKLVHADAIDWMKTYSGEGFDLIIDDLFCEQDGEPVEVARANTGWFKTLTGHLNAGGLIVKNFVDGASLRSSAPVTAAAFRKRFKTVFALSTPQDANTVGVFLSRNAVAAELRRRLRESPDFSRALRSGRLSYQIRSVTR